MCVKRETQGHTELGLKQRNVLSVESVHMLEVALSLCQPLARIFAGVPLSSQVRNAATRFARVVRYVHVYPCGCVRGGRRV
jgi:hypothetical protein